MKSLLISVIIPAYNAENYIESCIASILNQSYDELEIIVVDDGSEDATGKILERLAKKDSRIVVIRTENKGQGHARNVGLEASHGSYISFIDADDLLEPDMYERLVGLIESSGADFSGVGHKDSIEGKIIEKTNDRTKQDKEALKKMDRKDALRRYSYGTEGGIAWGVWDKLFRRESIGDLRFSNEKIRAQDTSFLLEFIKRNSCYSCVEEGKYIYTRSNPNSYTKKKFGKSNIGLTIFYRNLYLAMIEYNITDRIHPTATRYYENLLSSLIRFHNVQQFEYRDLLIDELKANWKQIKAEKELKFIYKIDMWLCIHLPGAFRLLNKGYH